MSKGHVELLGIVSHCHDRPVERRRCAQKNIAVLIERADGMQCLQRMVDEFDEGLRGFALATA